MMRKIELNPRDQKMLADRYLANIRDCNAQIRKLTATYNDWENAPERVKARYTREEYYAQFMPYWRDTRRKWIYKLQEVRQGYILE